MFLHAGDRHYIEALAVLLQCFAKGARFRLPSGKEFLDPCGSAAVFDTSGLGVGQCVVYDHFIT